MATLALRYYLVLILLDSFIQHQSLESNTRIRSTAPKSLQFSLLYAIIVDLIIEGF